MHFPPVTDRRRLIMTAITSCDEAATADPSRGTNLASSVMGMGIGKRFVGFVVMIVTLLAVVVIGASFNGARAVTGSAQVAPAPPTVGQCLLERPGRFGGWGFGQPLYPALQLASCTGYRWGEVVSVLPGALAEPTNVTTTDNTGDPVAAIPNQSLCNRDKLTYLSARTGQNTQWGWELVVGTVAAVGPTSLQRTAGQSWVACVVTPANGQAATSARYSGSVRNTLNTGVFPVAFATCSTTIGAAGILPESCDRPHRVEVFGVATNSPGDTQSGLDATCLNLVRWLMRTPDPTKLRLLTVRAFTTHTGSSGEAVEGIGLNGDDACIVEPAVQHNLHGTLIGLGLKPIPWA